MRIIYCMALAVACIDLTRSQTDCIEPISTFLINTDGRRPIGDGAFHLSKFLNTSLCVRLM